jgi:magnesium chelatase family protein
MLLQGSPEEAGQREVLQTLLILIARVKFGLLRLLAFAETTPGTVLDRVRDAQLVLTLQPCPCGFYGDPLRECVCTVHWIARHTLRMRALLERVAIAVEIPRPDYERQMTVRAQESSATVAARVREGWKRQQGRFAGLSLTRNAEMDHAQIIHWCSLDASAQKLSRAACQQLRFSVRTMDAMLTVARTVADLAGSEQIQANHLAEAIQYQPRPDQF